MAANKLIFKDAEKARDAILYSQKKRLQLYMINGLILWYNVIVLGLQV